MKKILGYITLYLHSFIEKCKVKWWDLKENFVKPRTNLSVIATVFMKIILICILLINKYEYQ